MEINESDAKLVQDIAETHRTLSRENRLEALHDATQYKEQAQAMFDLGLLDLETKAKIERIYWQIARNVVRFFEGMRYIPEEVRELANNTRRPVHVQFLDLPVAAGPLGAGPVVPDHAHSPARTSPPSAAARWWTSRATRTARSTSSSTCRTSRTRCRCTLCNRASRTISGCFWSARTRTSWAICTTFSGACMRSHVFLDEDEESGWYIEETIEGSTIAQVLALTQWHQPELGASDEGAGRCGDQDRIGSSPTRP